MREAAFVKKNYDKWQEFEELLVQERADPDRLADLFVTITDDLAYAQTRYPEAQSTQYLNGLASKLHQTIYRNKREKRNRFITFWKHELPLVFRSAHKEMLYALIIFLIACAIGAISAANDQNFVRLILGDGYVNMTLENIENGDPLGGLQEHGKHRYVLCYNL